MSRLINRTTGRTIAERAEVAHGFWALFRGLMGRAAVPPGFALGLPGCDWVHTWGMRVPLDIAFCGPLGHVLHVFGNVPPFRLLPRVRGAAIAWEMAAGQMTGGQISPGDVVVFE